MRQHQRVWSRLFHTLWQHSMYLFYLLLSTVTSMSSSSFFNETIKIRNKILKSSRVQKPDDHLYRLNLSQLCICSFAPLFTSKSFLGTLEVTLPCHTMTLKSRLQGNKNNLQRLRPQNIFQAKCGMWLFIGRSVFHSHWLFCDYGMLVRESLIGPAVLWIAGINFSQFCCWT